MLIVQRDRPDNLPDHLSLVSRQKTQILFCEYKLVITVQEESDTVNSLVVVAYRVHPAIQVLAFRDHFCRAVDSTHKRRCLQGVYQYIIGLGGPCRTEAHQGRQPCSLAHPRQSQVEVRR